MTRGFFSLALSGIVVSFTVSMVLMVYVPSEAQPRKVGFSPVRITEVTMVPDPFIIGKSALTMAVLVELPPSLQGANVLEVSVMITSPTRRSMSFVAQRRMVDDLQVKGKKSTVPMVLVWDGKDQYHQLVADGSYYYELQAKLMEDQGNGPRTKIVSHRVRGTLQALAYPGEVVPFFPPETEPVIPEDIETPDGGESFEEDGPMIDEGLEFSDNPEIPGDDNTKEAEEMYPEEARRSGSDSRAERPEEKEDPAIVEKSEAEVSELFIESMPTLPRPGEEILPGH